MNYEKEFTAWSALVKAAETVPYTPTRGLMMGSCMVAEQRKNHPEGALRLLEEIKKSFTGRVIHTRVLLTRGIYEEFEITDSLLVVLQSDLNSPAEISMVIAYLLNFLTPLSIEPGKVTAGISTYLKAFPNGLPTLKAFDALWDAQKIEVEGNYHNLVDFIYPIVKD